MKTKTKSSLEGSTIQGSTCSVSSEKSGGKPSTKKGSKKITAKDRKILLHLKGQNKMKEHEDHQAERLRKSETKNDSSSILVFKKKSRRKSLGMENHLSRQQHELNVRVKQRIKKVMTLPKRINGIPVDQFWTQFGPLMYQNDPLICPSTFFG